VFRREDRMDNQRQQREKHEIEEFSFVCHKDLRLLPPLRSFASFSISVEQRAYHRRDWHRSFSHSNSLAKSVG
jgi:hypothetical protein